MNPHVTILAAHTLLTGGTLPEQYTPLAITYQSFSPDVEKSQSSVRHTSVPYGAMLRKSSFFFKFLFPHRHFRVNQLSFSS